jgi:hypothetical protein
MAVLASRYDSTPRQSEMNVSERIEFVALLDLVSKPTRSACSTLAADTEWPLMVRMEPTAFGIPVRVATVCDAPFFLATMPNPWLPAGAKSSTAARRSPIRQPHSSTGYCA